MVEFIPIHVYPLQGGSEPESNQGGLVYDSCRTLLDHMIAVSEKKSPEALVRPLEHLVSCAQRCDCPHHVPCFQTTSDFRGRILHDLDLAPKSEGEPTLGMS